MYRLFIMRMRDFLFLFIIAWCANCLAEDIDVGGSELPRTYAALKQKIKFGERAALGLGHAEVRVNDAQKADTSLRRYPEEASEISPVPGAWIQHVRGENTADYPNNIAKKEKKLAGVSR